MVVEEEVTETAVVEMEEGQMVVDLLEDLEEEEEVGVEPAQ